MTQPEVPQRPAKLFISYSRADAAHLTALETHLATLERQKLIEAWTDRALQPGVAWSPELLGALRSADIVLLLVSPDFMASDYIHDVELKETFDRHARGEVRVIPIRVRPTDLKGDRLDTLQGLPRDRKPIVKWGDKDEAWLDVVNGIRSVLPSLKLPLLPDPIPGEQPKTSPERRQQSQALENALREFKALERAGADPSMLAEARARVKDLRGQLLRGHLQAGAILDDRYRLYRVLGQGGFATAWLAADLTSCQPVVLKILHAPLIQQPERLERFKRGSRIMSELEHPHILKVLTPYAVSEVREGTENQAPHHYVVLRWAKLGDLHAHLRAHPDTPLSIRLTWLLQAARGLEHAHARKQVHRDVKPQNILLMENGIAQVTDFDLAKLVDSSLLTSTRDVGTAYYSSPEVTSSHGEDLPGRVDHRADIYSLGMTLIYAVRAQDISTRELKRFEKTIEGLSAPESLKNLIRRATEDEPEDRFPSMGELIGALEQVLAELAVSPQTPALSPAPQKGGKVPLTELAPKPDAWWERPDFAKLPVSERIKRLLELGKQGDPRLGMHNPDRWQWIAPGSFVMGEGGEAHPVTLTSGFWMGRYPVTNAEFKLFVDAKGYDDSTWWTDDEGSWKWRQEKKITVPGFWRDAEWNAPNQPVVTVSWYEARAYCRWLTAWLKQHHPGLVNDGQIVRLPTEAEWEFAARGSQGRRYPWGPADPTPEHANFARAIGRTSPVGAFPLGNTPTTGLCDLAGNVWEWCADWYDAGYYKQSRPTDPVGPGKGSSRVCRGGGWNNYGNGLRSAFRFNRTPDDRIYFLGFRVVRAVAPPVPG